MFTVRQAAQLRYRLFIAMSMGEAKQLLGFPPGASPDPREINKAYKALALKHHPDRGGEHYKMVELNVAKEILEGKRVNDRTRVRKGPKEDPEVKRRREEEERSQREREAAKRDLKGIRDKVDRLATQFKGRMATSFDSKWTESLADYLTSQDDFSLPGRIDRFLDAADRALAGTLDPKDERVWKAAQREAEAVMGLALRVGRKFRELTEIVKRVQDKSLAFYEVESFHRLVPEFLGVFMALAKRSGKLTTIANTTEALPMHLVEHMIDKNHQMVIAYRDDFQNLDKFIKTEGAALGGAIEEAVTETVERLNKAGVNEWFARWEDWSIPEDFDAAAEHLDTPKTANVTMVDRVAARAIIEDIRRQADLRS